MTEVFTSSRRGLVLTLLVALLAGPSGLTGVLHPFDDIEHLPPPAGSADVAASLGQEPGPAVHCPTCHLLRDLRWGVSTSLAAVCVPLVVSRSTCAEHTHPTAASVLSASGRSPPSISPQRAG